MAGNTTTLIVQILTDASKASKGTTEAASGYQKMAGEIDKLVPAAAITVGALAAIGTAAYNSASRTEQAVGALDSVFGRNARVVEGWANTAAQSVGLAKSEYSELASVIGAQLNNLGLSSEDALSGTKSLISMGADLAATFGGTTAQAVEALSSALRGEADPAERYGLSLNQTAVNAKLAADGLSGLEGDALRTAKTQAILALATEQAGGAMGQFSRESGTAAGTAARAQAEFENASSALGAALLPAVTAVTEKLGDFAKWAGENTGLVLTLGGAIGTIAGIILVLAAAMKVAAVAQWAMNSALLASPVTWVVVAIVALVAAFIFLWNNVEGFRNFWVSIWAGIQSAAAAVWSWLTGATDAVFSWLIGAAVGWLGFWSGVWSGVQSVAAAVWGWLTGAAAAVFSFLAGAASSYLSFWAGIWSSIQNAAAAAWGLIRNAGATMFAGIQASAAALGSFFSGIWNGISSAAASVFAAVRNAATAALNAIMGPINAVASGFQAVVNAVRGVIDWIGRIKIPNLAGLIGFGAAPASAYSTVYSATPTGYAPAGYRRSPAIPGGFAALAGGGGGVVININGGLDSADTIARRVEQILSSRARRSGGVTITRRAS